MDTQHSTQHSPQLHSTENTQLQLQLTPNTRISAQHALQVYVASAGLIFLALERLNKHYYPEYDAVANSDAQHITETDLYAILAAPSSLQQLQELTRAQIIMRTFEAANQALQVAMSKLPMMEPFEASKTATTLITKLEELTNNHKQEINVNQFVWENVIPEEAAAAIAYLKQQTESQPEQITHNQDLQQASTHQIIDHFTDERGPVV